MKYVIVDKGFVEIPIIFSECQNHDEFKAMGEITGAGFLLLSVNEHGEKTCHVYGKSTSLGIQAKEDDEFLINQMLRNY